jgi:uncharacterized protein
MYNTLGNFIVQPKAGLLFIAFHDHRILQLTGTSTMTWKDEQSAKETGEPYVTGISTSKNIF